MNTALLRRLFLTVGIFAIAFVPLQSHGAAGELYESDLDSSSIAKFTAKGARSTVTTGIFDLFGIAFNSKGELFAASDTGNRIYKVSANGTKTVFTSAVNGPFALAFDRFDNLFACNFRTGAIVKITPAKVVTPFASGLAGPVGLAFNSSGFLFVSCQSDGTYGDSLPTARQPYLLPDWPARLGSLLTQPEIFLLQNDRPAESQRSLLTERRRLSHLA